MIPLTSAQKLHGQGTSIRVLSRIAFVTATIVDATGNRVRAEGNEEANPFDGIWSF